MLTKRYREWVIYAVVCECPVLTRSDVHPIRRLLTVPNMAYPWFRTSNQLEARTGNTTMRVVSRMGN